MQVGGNGGAARSMDGWRRVSSLSALRTWLVEEVGAVAEPDGARSCATEPEAARLRPLRAQGTA